jgi:hypothetical protein
MILYDARVECDMVLIWSVKSSGLQRDVIWRKATQNSILFIVTTMRTSFVLCFYVIGYTENDGQAALRTQVLLVKWNTTK